MRVCLDTNVLISGIFWKGLPGKVVDLWVEGRFDLLVSASILEEYKRVLRRLTKKLDAEIAETWIAKVVEKASVIAAPLPQKRWSRDRSDDKFIQCAISGRAEYLVTGDLDLLDLEASVPFQIVSPEEFLKVAREMP